MNHNAKKRLCKSAKSAKDMVKKYIVQKYRIIYCDETMITRSTIHQREYTNAYKRVEINQQSLNDQTLAILAGISRENGIEKVMIFDHSVDKWKFKMFIQTLREECNNEKICIYFDNLAVHRSKDVRDELDNLKIPYIFCHPYSPDCNPIESVFSIYKNILRRRRLQALSKG